MKRSGKPSPELRTGDVSLMQKKKKQVRNKQIFIKVVDNQLATQSTHLSTR
jgi:hypothetical protein